MNVTCGICKAQVVVSRARRTRGQWICSACPVPVLKRTRKQKNPKRRRERLQQEFYEDLQERLEAKQCPTPGKRGYATEDKALEVLERIWGRQNRSWYPIAAYKCQCGKYHHTKKPQRRQK